MLVVSKTQKRENLVSKRMKHNLLLFAAHFRWATYKKAYIKAISRPVGRRVNLYRGNSLSA